MIPIVIEAFLDERENEAGGKGRAKFWLSGLPVGEIVAPTLTPGRGTQTWSLDMYLMAEATPYSFNRASFWKTARAFVLP